MDIKAELTIPGKYLNALAQFAATKDVRFYLTGVCVEVDRHVSHLIASDGSMLAAYRHCEEVNISAPVQATIPMTMLKGLKQGAQYTLQIGDITHEDGSAYTRTVAIGLAGNIQVGNSLDGRYPEWRRAIPHGEVSGEISQFDPDKIARAHKAYRQLNGTKTSMTIGHNGNAAAVISMRDPNFFAVVMPLRETGVQTPDNPFVQTRAPAWAGYGNAASDLM